MSIAERRKQQSTTSYARRKGDTQTATVTGVWDPGISPIYDTGSSSSSNSSSSDTSYSGGGGDFGGGGASGSFD